MNIHIREGDIRPGRSQPLTREMAWCYQRREWESEEGHRLRINAIDNHSSKMEALEAASKKGRTK